MVQLLKSSPSEQSSHQLRVRAGAGLVLLCVLVFALAYQRPMSRSIDIGTSSDERFLDGFYFAEQQGEATFRWSGPVATVTFPGMGSRPWLLLIRMAAPRPAGVVLARLHVNGQFLEEIELGGQMTELQLTIPRHYVGFVGTVQLQLDSDTFVSPPDERQLGVMLDWIELKPASGGLTQPPWPVVAGLIACVIGFYVALMNFGLTVRWALWMALVACAGLALTLLLAGPFVSRYLPWGVLGLAGICAMSVRAGRIAWWEWPAAGALAFSLHQFTSRASEFYTTGLPPGDFSIYFDAARNLRLGLPLYDFVAARGIPNGPVYKYPPLFGILLSPATVFSAESVAAVWYLLNLGLLGLTFILLWRGVHDSGRRSPVYFYLLAVGFLNFRPAWESLIRGQLDVLILFVAVVALLLARTSRTEGLAGVALAFVTMLKLYPGLLVLYMLWRRRWRVVAGFAVASTLFISLSGLAVGWETLWRYMSEILTVQTAAVPWPENQSYDGFLGRLVIPPQETTWYTTIPFPVWARWALYGLDALTIGITMWVWRAVSLEDWERFALGYAAGMPLIVLMWPTAWIHYQTLLLLPFALLLGNALRRRPPRLVVILLVFSFLLVGVGNEYSVLRPNLESGWPRLLQSYKLFGVLLLWALMLWTGRRLTLVQYGRRSISN